MRYLSVVAVLLASCSMTPAYQRPPVHLPATFAGAIGNTAPVQSAWWQVYQEPTLDTLVVASLTHNHSMASAIAAVEQARGVAEKAGATLYPSLGTGATFDRAHQGGHSGSNSRSQSVFTEASYEIDFWGFNAANAHSAAMLARASEFDRDTVALTLTASVVDTFFEWQSLERRLTLARSIADDARHVLTLVLAQKDAGVATELQVQQQRNALATFEADVPALQQQLDIARHKLAVLTGTTPGQFTVQRVDLIRIPIPQPSSDLPSSLLETRPDIRAKEAQLQSSNFDVGAARAAFMPNIVLTADGGFKSKSLSNFLASPFASLAASLVAPVFDGGALRGQLRAARGAEAKSVADYRQTVISALQDVEDSLTTAQQQALAEASRRTAADAAIQAATLAEAQYRSGTVDFLTVLDAQRIRYQAEDTLEQARLARLQASVSLYRAFGGGFETSSRAS